MLRHDNDLTRVLISGPVAAAARPRGRHEAASSYRYWQGVEVLGESLL